MPFKWNKCLFHSNSPQPLYVCLDFGLSLFFSFFFFSSERLNFNAWSRIGRIRFYHGLMYSPGQHCHTWCSCGHVFYPSLYLGEFLVITVQAQGFEPTFSRTHCLFKTIWDESSDLCKYFQLLSFDTLKFKSLLVLLRTFLPAQFEESYEILTFSCWRGKPDLWSSLLQR